MGWKVKTSTWVECGTCKENNGVGGQCLCPLPFNTPPHTAQKRGEKRKYGKNVKSERNATELPQICGALKLKGPQSQSFISYKPHHGSVLAARSD